MDVTFLNDENITLHLKKSWENLKKSTDKKIFMVNDLDKNLYIFNICLIYDNNNINSIFYIYSFIYGFNNY